MYLTNKLQQYFPMIRSREEVRGSISADAHLAEMFGAWSSEKQEEFLDMCTGVKGMKPLYDSFFKEIMNPEYNADRLNEFLSLLLKRTVKIRTVLPNDSTRITDESSLLITDIVVELEDGSLANVEIQKIGYAFPGQRCACYSADMLLRQYRRVRGNRENFSYRDIKSVYTIILFEKSTKEFHDFPQEHFHFFSQISNTGIELELLQKYVFIPLDIFRKNLHNKGIINKLDAWLTFFSEDEPEVIIRLIEKWPEFKVMYEEIYNQCRSIEGVMNMFSKELQELDRNTVQYMIDELQEEIDKKVKENDEKSQELDKMNRELDKKNRELDKKDQEIDKKNQELDKMDQELDKKNQELDKKDQELDKKNQELNEKDQRIRELEALLQRNNS